jgi:hypothetical protein
MSKRDAALSILLQAKVLKNCPIHSDSIFDLGGEVVDAYKLANWKFSRGELSDTFATRTDMTNEIKAAYEEYAETECGLCASVMAE